MNPKRTATVKAAAGILAAVGTLAASLASNPQVAAAIRGMARNHPILEVLGSTLAVVGALLVDPKGRA